MRDFRALKVWEKSYQTTLHVYELTRTFPKDEVYGLISQLRRASASIPINIAEGCGRRTDAELAQFLQIAMGSASELECELLLAKDLRYAASEGCQKLARDVEELKKMLATFIGRLRGT